MTSEYKPADLARDTARYWSQLAKDWAQAWAFGIDLVQDVADQGTTLVPSPPSRQKSTETPQAVTAGATGAAEPTAAADLGRDTTTIPAAGLKEGDVLTPSDLVCIEAGGVTIRASELVAVATTLPGGVPAVRLSISAGDRRPGMYVGTVTVAGGTKIPVQLYVSRAVHGSP